MAKVTMPQLGESVAEGTIGKWLKKPGDHVDKYEPLLEVITDKVNAEVPSPFEGTLREILVEEGATVPNNAEIAVIETAEAPTDAAESTDAAEPTATTGATATAATAPTANGEAPVNPPMSQEKPAAASEPDTGGAHVELREPATGPAGSDERPTRVAERGPSVPVEQTLAPPQGVAPNGGSERAAAAATAPPPSASASTSTPATTPAADQAGNADARMTPAVRRLLREHGLEASQIVGTGGGGRISREDVVNYVEAQRTGQPVGGQAVAGDTPATTPPAVAATAQPTPARAAEPARAAPSVGAAVSARQVDFPDGADEVLVPMTQMRKGIAAQMTRALQAPHAYVQMEVDATRLVAFRERVKEEYRAKEGISLSFVPFVVKASAEALKRNPTFNAIWTDDGVLAKRRINIGVAVAVEDGLIVPVIRDADTLSVHGLNKAISDVAGRARANKLRVDDFGGGTFTVDNTGYLGTNLVMPILNVPEVGIVTMEAITKRPIAVSTPDGDVIAIRPIMNMVLGIDHRANDGAGGAALLRDIKSWLESVGPDTPIY
ncbi:MAG TPA: dihydrolipoamide acetyltransferase family protein [Candidatus Limnocylindrales bacterium]|nr:dihydrolipoamide acetyltransferase family protein [Candidatus Limnocylindrales bacterium]